LCDRNLQDDLVWIEMSKLPTYSSRVSRSE
jgi:hypothetical protein